MKVDDNSKNEDICSEFCGTCPSYPDTDEWLFCARGKSKREITKQACLCPVCQVYADYGLKDDYHCIKGVE